MTFKKRHNILICMLFPRQHTGPGLFRKTGGARASTGINITKDNKVLLQTKVAGEQTLPDTGYLPSARGTQRSPKNTRQRVCRVLHSANDSRQTLLRQTLVCRVFFVVHSAKTLPSAKKHSANFFYKIKIKKGTPTPRPHH